MIKSITSFILLYLLLQASVWSAPVPPERALQIALSQLKRSDKQRTGAGNLQLHSIQTKRNISNLTIFENQALPDQNAQQPSFYIITDDTGGFVIVSGDDLAKPILGVSTHAIVDSSNLPTSFVFLDGDLPSTDSGASKNTISPFSSDRSSVESVIKQ